MNSLRHQLQQQITSQLFKHRLLPLRTILLVVMLTVSALPLAGLYFFRIYENELVQQTELELISQAAALSANYRQFIRIYLRTTHQPTNFLITRLLVFMFAKIRISS